MKTVTSPFLVEMLKAWKKLVSKKALWEKTRALFSCFLFDSMQTLYLAILHGFEKHQPIIQWDTS